MKNKQPKPIVVIRIPIGTVTDDEFPKVVDGLTKAWNDYNVLVIRESIDKISVETYYPSDFGTIEIETLQKQINEVLKDTNKFLNNELAKT